MSTVRSFVKNAVLDRIPGVLRKGPADSKRVALTFDDGPDRMTGKYLELLDDLGVPATFFVCGERAVEHPDLIREYLRRGHQVANHGFDHESFPKLSRRALRARSRRLGRRAAVPRGSAVDARCAAPDRPRAARLRSRVRDDAGPVRALS